MAVERRAAVRPQGGGKSRARIGPPSEPSPFPGVSLEAGSRPSSRETYIPSSGAEGRRSQE